MREVSPYFFSGEKEKSGGRQKRRQGRVIKGPGKGYNRNGGRQRPLLILIAGLNMGSRLMGVRSLKLAFLYFLSLTKGHTHA